VLVALAEITTPATNRDVHTALGHNTDTEAATGRALRRLEEKGYVAQSSAPNRNENALTDAGIDLLERADQL